MMNASSSSSSSSLWKEIDQQETDIVHPFPSINPFIFVPMALQLATATARVKAEMDQGFGGNPNPNPNSPPQRTLKSILQSKQRFLQSQLSSLQLQQPEELQARLISTSPSSDPNALVRAIRMNRPRISIIAEVARIDPEESPTSLAHRCKGYVQSGK